MKKTHLAFKKPLIRTTICGPKPILGVKNTSYISLNESLKRILYLREYLSSFPGGRLPSVLCALCGPGSRPTTSARRSHLIRTHYAALPPLFQNPNIFPNAFSHCGKKKVMVWETVKNPRYTFFPVPPLNFSSGQVQGVSPYQCWWQPWQTDRKAVCSITNSAP